MANRGRTGKGKGGFGSTRTKRWRKHTEQVKYLNRRRTQDPTYKAV
jgi:hypothetical protein